MDRVRGGRGPGLVLGEKMGLHVSFSFDIVFIIYTMDVLVFYVYQFDQVVSISRC